MPSGVRNALDNAIDRAIESRRAGFVYLTSEFITGVVCEAALWVGRRLPRW